MSLSPIPNSAGHGTLHISITDVVDRLDCVGVCGGRGRVIAEECTDMSVPFRNRIKQINKLQTTYSSITIYLYEMQENKH